MICNVSFINTIPSCEHIPTWEYLFGPKGEPWTVDD